MVAKASRERVIRHIGRENTLSSEAAREPSLGIPSCDDDRGAENRGRNERVVCASEAREKGDTGVVVEEGNNVATHAEIRLDQYPRLVTEGETEREKERGGGRRQRLRG